MNGDQRLDLVAQHRKGPKIPVDQIFALRRDVDEIIDAEGGGQNGDSDDGENPGGLGFYAGLLGLRTGLSAFRRRTGVRIISHDFLPRRQAGEVCWSRVSIYGSHNTS